MSSSFDELILRRAQDDRLYVTLHYTVTLSPTVTLSLSKRDSIAYPKSHGSQEATSASFDELRMTGKYSSCPCGFAKDYLRWYINEKGRTDTRLALDFDRTIMK
jgi:hypothetical protein